MIAFLILTAATPMLSVPAAVLDDDRATLSGARLAWPEETDLRLEDRGSELVVRSERAIGEDRIAAFREAAGAAIGELRWNDDSLVLRASPGWSMRWRRVGSVVIVAFAATAGDTPADPTEPADDTHDVALAAIQADAAAGYPGRARRAAAMLAAADPADSQAARMLADTQVAAGDVRGAARGYRALGAPDRTARRTIAAAAGVVSIGVTVRDGSDLSQAELGARIDAAIDDRLSAGGGVRHIASRVATPGPDEKVGETVIDASVAAALGDAVRLQLLASAALDDRVTGGGAKLTAGSPEAQVRATLLRHMPDYSTPAQVLAGGYLSRATAGVTYRLTPGLVGQADAGWNRYGLAGMAAASDTITASGGLDYTLRRQFPTLGLSYRFEAEYVERMRVDADGRALVSLATRENHTLQGVVGGLIGAVQLTGLAGWTVDRFGGDGPTASVGLAAPIGIAWRVEGGAGVTSVSRPGFSGTQLFARAQVSRALGDGK